jgi:hypothetical protein
LNKELKLNLINDYIKIYKLYYKCKTTFCNQDYKYLNNTLARLDKLKKEYETIIYNNKLYDNSFILLKQQLENTLTKPLPKQLPTENQNIFEDISTLEQTAFETLHNQEKI